MTDTELQVLLRARDLALAEIDQATKILARDLAPAIQAAAKFARDSAPAIQAAAKFARDSAAIDHATLYGGLAGMKSFDATLYAPTSVARPWELGPPEIYMPRAEEHPEPESPAPPGRRIGYAPWS